MKKKFILLPIVGILLYGMLSSYTSGPGTFNLERTGATGAAGCYTGSTCHSTSATSGITIGLELDSAGVPVTNYVAGGSYTVKITGTNTTGSTGLTYFGFQVAVVKQSGAGSSSATNAGNLLAGTGTHTVTPSGTSVKVVEHSSQIIHTTGTGGTGTTYVISVPWTAPTSGTGGAYIYSALNAVNFNFSADVNDLWNTGSSSLITEEVGPITGTASVCVGSTTTLSDVTPGGTWSSGNTSIATVGSTGIVTGVAPGTAVISYATGSFGTATRTVTVSTPTSITGTLTVCQGLTTALSGTVGIWTTSNAGVASVNTLTGLVNGIVTGSTSPATAIITLTPLSGCPASVTVTVNPLPSTITGVTGICAGTTTTLNSTPSGGGWSSGSTSVATVDPSSGVVSGIVTGSPSPATAVITYSLTTGCLRTTTVTVNPMPSAITGTTVVCSGATTTLNSTPAGGSWSSSSTGTATVTSGGVVTGAGAGGTVTISYTLGICSATTIVTVNPSPPAIGGTLIVCAGGTTILNNTSGGGTWSSSNTTIASFASSSSGTLTGGAVLVSTPVTITYTSSAGCTTTTTVTANPLPASITGTAIVCPGATTTLSSTTLGGTWSSSNPTAATIGVATSGIVTGASGPNTTIITYSVAGCSTNTIVTVNQSPAPIGGSLSVCSGATTILSSAPPGGTWSSANGAIASIIPGTGSLTGGTTTGPVAITYLGTNGCSISATVTVNPLPSPISGPTNICSGGTTLLSSSPTGGTWTSSNSTIASVVSSTGLVTGGSVGGTPLITYTAPGGCTTSTIVTVNATIAPILGSTTTVCSGQTISFTDGTFGGTWSSSDNSVATVGSTGTVTGVGAGGTAAIFYTVGSCFTGINITVNPSPAQITGTSPLVPVVICAGTTTTLSDISTPGTWSSTNSAIATIGSISGFLTAGATPGGTATILYTLSNGCSTSVLLNVTPLPSAITGATGICFGTTSTLTSLPAGGTWSSSNTAIASVGVLSGLVTGGIVPATATITYILSPGCTSSIVVTVNPQPSAISGNPVICVGLTSALTDGGGGTWSSSSTPVATVLSGSGTVTGVIPGTATITYTLPTGCSTTKDVTVNSLPTSIGGTISVCRGLTTSLTNGTAGGTWTSSGTTLATVDIISGIVTGVASGTPTITYTMGAGCYATAVVTVNPIFPISGPSSICSGLSAPLSDGAAGGTWSSSDLGVATIVTGTGLITGVAPGTTAITYLLPTGCTTTTTVTVVSAPPPIGGNPNVCIGSTTVLTDPGGGTWSSSNTSVASVGTSGIVSGLSTGTATINYSLGTGCSVDLIVTVSSLPSPITGTTHVCVGSVTTLGGSPSGGTWTGSNANVSVDLSTGDVTGMSGGTSLITYTSPAGCIRTTPVTVNALPAPITGTMSMCIGASTTLADPSGAGTWSSSDISTVTVGSATGTVTGTGLGTASIIFTATSTGCSTSTTVTVNSLPSGITGTANVCAGSAITLGNPTPGGTWSSASTGIATVDISTGTVSGVAAGTTNITYSLGAGCNVMRLVTVNTLPGTIIGSSNLCAGSTMSLINGTPGGFWSSSNNGVATITLLTGIVTGVAQGIDTITYTILSTGCARRTAIVINPIPAPITGNRNICNGSSSTLSNDTTSGTWTSGATSVAIVGLTTGVVNSVSAGTANITYTLPTGCKAIATVTVNPLPAGITGTTTVCEGANTLLNDITTGGTWSNSGSGNTSVGAGTGVVTGISAGTDVITYTISTGCKRTISVTVNPSPAAITGTGNICSGSALILNDATPGGTWSSGATGVATVGSSTGIVIGVGAGGAAIITYKISNGCTATTTVIVNPLPSVFGGSATVCTGATTTLTDAITGGTWSSTFPGIAAIGLTSGTLSGITPGTSPVTYILPTGCQRTSIVTVNPSPLAITGASNICSGTTTTLIDPTTGGSWSSSSTSTATIGLISGIVSGVSSGSVTIVYTLSTGCSTSTILAVNPSPSPISGTTNICSGSSSALSDLTGGGSWSSSSTAIASVDAITGVVTGMAASVATISYSLSTGCSATTVITVNALPAPIAGTPIVCSGATTLLTDISLGGIWSSGSSSLATVDPTTGNVSAITAGVTNILYTLPTGCFVTIPVTVNASPQPIFGATDVCIASTISLGDSVTGGTWSSSAASVGTIGSSSGIFTGVSAGTSIVTYMISTGCRVYSYIRVNPLPLAITGKTIVCTGAESTLHDASSGGIWSTGNPAVVYVDPATGILTGVTAGIAGVTYTLPTGCQTVTTATINQSPAAITGNTTVCVGATTDLNDATPGGTWSSSNNTVASVDAGGIVTGISQGSVTITYRLVSGCIATTTVTDFCSVGVNQVILSTGALNIIPNPNRGVFTLTGAFGSSNNEEVVVEVTDMLGKVVYRNNVSIINGKINENISLSSNIADGMYLLNVQSGSTRNVFHFVIQK